jgi:hypothetical protein
MPGIEGVDYVITECGHCKGTGKCACKGCAVKAWNELKQDLGLEEFFDMFDRDLDNLVCSACAGSGKVVFWRE